MAADKAYNELITAIERVDYLCARANEEGELSDDLVKEVGVKYKDAIKYIGVFYEVVKASPYANGMGDIKVAS